jgi:thiosulfate dehydrogenase
MQRSLNGKILDSTSYEMKALVAYIKWTGNTFSNNNPAPGTGTPEPAYLKRAADSVAGHNIYAMHCGRCHGEAGEGTPVPGTNGYQYPPLWGNGSFTMNAGMYRLSRLAGFIKYNMPFDSAKLGFNLQDTEAWDVAAYIASKPRPVKQFPSDWPDISKKPFDHPFGPYADPFSEIQHKYGPFDSIIKYYKKNNRH